MSTFDGYVKEFPSIRIDYFRHRADRPAPAACFLSHVHSDHVQGLDTLKMPFVYCSATTRLLLLRMERYPYRINLAKGILESRKQTYRHLGRLLRPLPLQTATEIEVTALQKIQVTLFDANHCPGAVSFLIQGQSSAIFYTGDVRAEPWWVNSLVQNPYMLPYTCGLKTLDCVYLDTTFASRKRVCQRFPSKADGLKELLLKLTHYPPDTVFYFRAWTLGYEHVWMAMSSLLSSQVHVDEYQMRLFEAIAEDGRDGYAMFEAPSLVGFTLGNHYHAGRLTLSSAVRIHSCEPGMKCHEQLTKSAVVWVTPIVARLQDGSELHEAAADAGLGDLYQSAQLELDDSTLAQQLYTLCTELRTGKALPKQLQHVIATTASASGGLPCISLDGLTPNGQADISIPDFIDRLSRKCEDGPSSREAEPPPPQSRANVLHFPYSRHSSYEELRHLLSILRPKDICPCTVNAETWSEDISMQSLFGDLCSADVFHHDQETRSRVDTLRARPATDGTSRRETDDESQSLSHAEDVRASSADSVHELDGYETTESTASETEEADEKLQSVRDRVRREAYKAALQILRDSDGREWQDVVLRCVGRNGHTRGELEL